MVEVINKEIDMRKLFTTVALVLACGPVWGLQIYHLQGNQYAIICEDGTGYSFSGSSTGAQEAGGLLCEEHGGIANIHNTTSANKALKALDTMDAPPSGKGVPMSKESKLQ